MPPDKKSSHSVNKNISISGDVKDSVVIVGNKNTVIQKFFNIFKSDAETLEQRNHRILLNHVENAWIKGVLDASLHGAALLDLGIKQDPEAVTQYPWAIKKESTDETLPAGTSMLEIFDSIGMGRSLLILGAPGSGKTTMLLELARQLIARAREDVTQPIPMVFNLASWTEKLALADWLTQELNNLYSVPRKTAPDWVKGNKLLLLLDGLDEVRQDNRTKCVEAINEFRKQNGLTSLAVCSRSQDYADLKAKLSFEGAIEVQPLTQEQVAEFFNRFGEEMAGIKQALEKDSALREMAETPLFLSIMLMAYQGKRVDEIPVFEDMDMQRRYLFEHYIERMGDRYKRFSHKFELNYNKTTPFKQQNVIHWLSWLAHKMIEHNQVSYLFEHMQPSWLETKSQEDLYHSLLEILSGISTFLLVGSLVGLFGGPLLGGIGLGISFGFVVSIFVSRLISAFRLKISMVDKLRWSWKDAIGGWIAMLIIGAILGLILTLIMWLSIKLTIGTNVELRNAASTGAIIGLFFGMISGTFFGLVRKQIEETAYVGQHLKKTSNIAALTLFFSGIAGGVVIGLLVALSRGLDEGLTFGLIAGLFSGLIGWLAYGGLSIIEHYTLRFVLVWHELLPWRLVPFLDHCVDLIFLRRVGGGYIFIHRLLMEHFAEMYVETTK